MYKRPIPCPNCGEVLARSSGTTIYVKMMGRETALREGVVVYCKRCLGGYRVWVYEAREYDPPPRR